jgi:hypothetical protein
MAGKQLPAAAGRGGKEPPMIGHQAVTKSARVRHVGLSAAGSKYWERWEVESQLPNNDGSPRSGTTHG